MATSLIIDRSRRLFCGFFFRCDPIVSAPCGS